MVGMLAMYAVIMAAGSQQADWESLLAGDWSQTPATVPILLLTLVIAVCLQTSLLRLMRTG